MIYESCNWEEVKREMLNICEEMCKFNNKGIILYLTNWIKSLVIINHSNTPTSTYLNDGKERGV
jgi:hypothetical protein